MSVRMIRPAAVIGSAGLLLTTAALSACGSSSSASPPSTASTAAKTSTTATKKASAPASSGTVAVTLSEFKIKPATSSVRGGRVVFTVTNSGKVKHQFTVIHTKKAAAAVLSKAKPNDDIPGAKGEIAAIQPGATKKLVIKDLKPGHYALVCALPGHYQSGMYADFNVT